MMSNNNYKFVKIIGDNEGLSSVIFREKVFVSLVIQNIKKKGTDQCFITKTVRCKRSKTKKPI